MATLDTLALMAIAGGLALVLVCAPMLLRASSKGGEMVQTLPSRLQRALRQNLRPGEQVLVQLQGAFKQALICTDTRVLILKGGIMCGQLFGTNCFQLRYQNVSGVEVKFSLFTGFFEMSSGGMQNQPRNFWSRSERTSPTRAANCVSLFNRSQARLFRQACSFILERVDQLHAPQAVHPAVRRMEALAALEQLNALRKEGALSDDEFRSKKAELLSRV